MTVSSTELDVNSEPSTEAAATESVATTEVKGVDSYEAAIEKALSPESEATPASSEQDPENPDPENSGDDEQKDPSELTEEEKKQLTPSQQHRIRELAQKTKAAQEEAVKFQQELEVMKPKAERMDQLIGYMQTHEITPDHLDNALGLTAMINRGDYRQALPILEGLIQQVRQAAGDVLPDDLQQQVNLGYITEQHARELNRAKAGERQMADKMQRERARQDQERQQREVQDVMERAVNAAEAWNREQATTDPDWNLKRELVTQGMELELLRVGAKGYPRTEKDVRDLLNKVKSNVEQNLSRFRPAPKPITPVTGGSVSPRSAAKPSSYLDAINLGLAKNG
ncbi:hypothetical protein [Brucella intermedia]|uniref:hypothetical protein n=1 Tax=Brucella intermedia TaxID=94625 RepID=UPI001590468C|nr:hypothetical protein [Brucella intermedia]